MQCRHEHGKLGWITTKWVYGCKRIIHFRIWFRFECVMNIIMCI